MTLQTLVTTAWLADHLHDDNLRLIDIRGRVLPASEPPPHYFSHLDAYEQAHIPNAVFIDWTTDIVEPDSPSYDVATPERYGALMSRLGIDAQTTVVAYDDANGMFAARLWWTLRYYGHESVAVLDGGWQKWCEENRPIDNNVPQIIPRTFTPRVNATLRATRTDIERQHPQLIDVRSTAEFNGERSRAERKGHIPNAVNLPRKQLLTVDGTLKPANELQQLFREAAITTDEEVIIYCNSGVSASYGLLALAVAGINSGRVYDSSWKEWGNADDTAIE
ncbi:MAG: sulfurtransferase [Anaerolineae bacterium]